MQRLTVVLFIAILVIAFLFHVRGNPPDIMNIGKIPLENPSGFISKDTLFEFVEAPEAALKTFSLKDSAVKTVDFSHKISLADNSVVEESAFGSPPFNLKTWCATENGDLLVEDPNISPEFLQKNPTLKNSRNLAILKSNPKMVFILDVGDRNWKNRKYSSFLDTGKCIYRVSQSDAPQACLHHKEYLSCDEKVNVDSTTKRPPYREKKFYDSKNGITYKYQDTLDEKDWPQEVTFFKDETKLSDTIILPKGPFLGSESLACLSCGCSCYRHLSLLHVNDNFYAVITGWSVPDKEQGIYQLINKRWLRLAQIGEYSHFFTSSTDGCYITWSETKSKNPTPTEKRYWKYVNVCIKRP